MLYMMIKYVADMVNRAIWYFGFYGTIAVAVVGYMYKPDTRWVGTSLVYLEIRLTLLTRLMPFPLHSRMSDLNYDIGLAAIIPILSDPHRRLYRLSHTLYRCPSPQPPLTITISSPVSHLTTPVSNHGLWRKLSGAWKRVVICPNIHRRNELSSLRGSQREGVYGV
jgi:hypothetical protein